MGTGGGRSWVGGVLVALVASPACGGRLLLQPQASGDAALSDDAALAAASADDTTASGGSGSSSGSSGSIPPGSSSGSASGGSTSTAAPPCGSASDCAPGLLCCATPNLVSTCRPSPCRAPEPLQFCATAAECVDAGASCSRLISEPEDSYLVCQ